ncbi:MAG: cytochrome c-type biogenesis protein [Rhodospirillales bacterium]
MRVTSKAVFLAMMLLAVASGAGAVNPSEILNDPALENRAREISKHLRCLVCQNQSIDDSDAELARDLRVLVRERLQAGDTDDQVIGYVVSRYGDFVLLKPPFKASTYVLWIGPGVVFLAGVIALILFFRRRARAGATPAHQPPPLSPEEKTRLRALMKESGD